MDYTLSRVSFMAILSSARREQIVSMPEWNNLGIMPQYPLRLLLKSDILLTESKKAYSNRSWTLVDLLVYGLDNKKKVAEISLDDQILLFIVQREAIVDITGTL